MTERKRRFNTSIVRLKDDGSPQIGGAYGARMVDGAFTDDCSERQAGLDPRGPIRWLENHRHGSQWTVLNDNGDRYYSDLRRELLPDEDAT